MKKKYYDFSYQCRLSFGKIHVQKYGFKHFLYEPGPKRVLTLKIVLVTCNTFQFLGVRTCDIHVRFF